MSIDLLLKQIISFNKIFCVNRFTQYVNRFTTEANHFFNKILCVNRFTQYVNRFTTERKLLFMKMFCVNRFNQGANRFTTEAEAFLCIFSLCKLIFSACDSFMSF